MGLPGLSKRSTPLLREFCNRHDRLWKPGKAYHIGVVLDGLEPLGRGQQLALFDPPAPFQLIFLSAAAAPRPAAQAERLMAQLDALNARFGRGTVQLASATIAPGNLLPRSAVRPHPWKALPSGARRPSRPGWRTCCTCTSVGGRKSFADHAPTAVGGLLLCAAQKGGLGSGPRPCLLLPAHPVTASGASMASLSSDGTPSPTEERESGYGNAYEQPPNGSPMLACEELAQPSGVLPAGAPPARTPAMGLSRTGNTSSAHHSSPDQRMTLPAAPWAQGNDGRRCGSPTGLGATDR